MPWGPSRRNWVHLCWFAAAAGSRSPTPGCQGMDSAVIGDQDMVAVLPADNRLAARNEVDYVELAKEPFILSTGGCAEVFMPMARRLGVDFDVAFEAREMSAVLEMARAASESASCPAQGCPHSPTAWWFGRWCPRPFVDSGWPSRRARRRRHGHSWIRSPHSSGEPGIPRATPGRRHRRNSRPRGVVRGV